MLIANTLMYILILFGLILFAFIINTMMGLEVSNHRLRKIAYKIIFFIYTKLMWNKKYNENIDKILIYIMENCNEEDYDDKWILEIGIILPSKMDFLKEDYSKLYLNRSYFSPISYKLRSEKYQFVKMSSEITYNKKIDVCSFGVGCRFINWLIAIQESKKRKEIEKSKIY